MFNRNSDRPTSSVPGFLAGLLPLLLAVGTPELARAEDIRIGGTGAALGTMQLLAQAYAKTAPEVGITVLPSIGSSGGIKALLAGAVQLAVSSRVPNENESKAGAVAVEYGRTPFVFATATSSKVTGLTTQNLVDFYSGKLEEWPNGAKLRLVLRPIGDSDSETIKNISAAMRDAKSAAEQRKGMVFTVTDQETASSIETTPGALGPSTLALILSERRGLKALMLDGVVPSGQNLANGSYPLFKQLMLVTGPKSSSEALAFVAFVRSPAGKELLQQTGHWVR
jgi:phosphate transport system substrate-binding protein